ncbi:MAG: hypothetical protein HKN47_25245 [Pirellulaceae bacterium]|nr:hypothetical protein [Pirellulaceae bacterium]
MDRGSPFAESTRPNAAHPNATRQASARSLSARRVRRGSFVIEVVMAAALFATAAIAIGRLAKSTSVLSLRADQQLAAQLTAENTLNELQQLAVSQIAQAATDIQEARSESSGMKVQIQTEPFQVDQRPAMHLTVHVTPEGAGEQSGTNLGVTLHDWRIASESASTTNPDASDQGGSNE